MRRNQSLMRNICTVFAGMTHSYKKDFAEKSLADCLMQWSWQNALATKIRNCAIQSKYIITNFRKAHVMNLERKLVLQGPIWGEELMRLCAVLTSSKESTSAQRALWELVVKTAEVRKTYITELYYYRQKLSCRVDFM